MLGWFEIASEPARSFLRSHVNAFTDGGGEHDEHDEHEGGRKRDVHRTSRMKAHSSHSTDTVRSRGNTDSYNSQPETRSLFLQIRQHQNVALEQKRLPL